MDLCGTCPSEVTLQRLGKTLEEWRDSRKKNIQVRARVSSCHEPSAWVCPVNFWRIYLRQSARGREGAKAAISFVWLCKRRPREAGIRSWQRHVPADIFLRQTCHVSASLLNTYSSVFPPQGSLYPPVKGTSHTASRDSNDQIPQMVSYQYLCLKLVWILSFPPPSKE